MELNLVLRRGCWLLVGLASLWFAGLLLLLHPRLQRIALYAHPIHTARFYPVDQPERWGFLRHQVKPFRIKSTDDVSLFAWLVSPVGRRQMLSKAKITPPEDASTDVQTSEAFRSLTDTTKPEPLLIIYFHGNAGCVPQGWRPDTYRILTGVSQQLHVLAFDYRGFGTSTGTPTEAGLISDGIAAVRWALDVAQVPPHRIVLVGQSLGTAVSTAVAEHFASQEQIEFAGLVLVSAFANLPTLLTTYAIGGFIPLLSPFRSYPAMQRFFQDKALDTWQTSQRLSSLIEAAERPNVLLLHAQDDTQIPYAHSEWLFEAASKAASRDDPSAPSDIEVHEMGSSGWRKRLIVQSSNGGVKQIEERITLHGGHNRIMTYPIVVEAIEECFKRTSKA